MPTMKRILHSLRMRKGELTWLLRVRNWGEKSLSCNRAMVKKAVLRCIDQTALLFTDDQLRSKPV